MPINAPTISPENARILTMMYQTLLENRQAMIDGMKAVEDSPYRRGVLVDALISGLIAHFHEFARNESVHAEEIAGWGPGFEVYANRFVDQVRTILTQLKA